MKNADKVLKFLIIFVIILVIIAIVLLLFTRNSANPEFGNTEPQQNTEGSPMANDDEANTEDQPQQPSRAPIEEDYGSKVIYNDSKLEDDSILINDCNSRGGSFNACGNSCEPGSELCAAVCVKTCDDIPYEDTSNPPGVDVPGEVADDKSVLIKVSSPQNDNEVIESPLDITGKARGPWYFEGQFPVVLTDWDGRIIAETTAEASGDWMTEEYVDFSAELEFENPAREQRYTQSGSLILQKANPTGLPENDNAYEIQVRFPAAELTEENDEEIELEASEDEGVLVEVTTDIAGDEEVVTE